mmetsp:Transcript_26811/g.53612  ORF Transcript_26811/g.53612 Transcript_26811/m.53612 type:complete len:1212 (+) Transcript_26811:61-3696(+)
METTNAAADSSKEPSISMPANPLDATEPSASLQQSHQLRADDSDGTCNQNTSTTAKEDDNNSHDVILPEPSSSNSSSSHDIGLSLSSFDVDAYNSLHRDLNLVPQGGTITSDDGNGNNNDDGGGEVPLSNSDGLSQLEPLAAVIQTDASTNGDDVVGTADNSKVVDGESQQIQQQPSSSKEEQLEHRIANLEQSLQQLSQFCQTILLNQQRQQQQQFNHRENSGSSEESTSLPTTPTAEEEEVNNHQWHNPSTTQYAPLDSPDASLNNRRRLSTMESSSLDGVREEEEDRGNMQMNSLSVKLGVTPYNNNNITKGNKKKSKELAPNKKTMSMLFLDIEPGQSRGPNLITLDAVAAASDEDDDGGGGNGNADVATGGDSDDGRRNSNGSSSGSNGSISSGSKSGCEEGSVSNDDEKKEGGSGDKDTPLLHSPSSSPVLHRQASYSSPTLTTVTEKSADATEGVGKEGTSSPSLPPSQVLPTRRRSGLSSSLKINPPHHFTKTEESLECQAYTPSHLEALRLRREVGKGRAYSCNDAVVSPPRSSRKGGDNNLQQLKLPTISSPVWKPSFEALNSKEGEGGEKSSITGITVDTSGNDTSASVGGKDISASIPQLIMPDLNAKNDEKMEEGGVFVVNIPTKRKESCGSASSAGNNSKSLPPSTSCASNMSTDTTRTPKSGNTKREVRANSIASSKERSQSVSSNKSKDSGSGVSAVAPANPTDTNNESLSSNKKDKKSESKSSSQQQQNQSDSGKNKTMSQYVINDLLNIDSRNHDGSATEDIDANMEEFLRIPSKFEYLMVFSLAVCVDSFLYPWAMLPLKFIWGLVCLACTIYKMIQKKKWRLNPDEADVHGIGFHRRHLYAILQSLLIWLGYSQILCPISIGKLYHWIRGQAMLKLYVLIAIVEVFDRLLCSFGQDAWDSLYWNTTRRPRHPRLFVSIIVVGVYVTIHSLFLFVHVATLSVAVNSADHALLTLLISGNFAEIKSTVFKKYNKQNLFKITTSDICERFKLALFLLLILFLNRFQGEMTSSMVNDYCLMCGIVFAAELISDWIKHSFITKFNFIKSTAYFDYALVLSGDVTGIGHEGLSLDYTHAAVKRLGLAQIPLVCVTARYLHEAVRFAIAFKGNGDVDHPFSALVDLMADGSKWKFYIGLLKCMGALVVFKVFLGICIRAVARRNLGGDSRVALKDKALSSKAPKVKDNKETTDTKKKQ